MQVFFDSEKFSLSRYEKCDAQCNHNNNKCVARSKLYQKYVHAEFSGNKGNGNIGSCWMRSDVSKNLIDFVSLTDFHTHRVGSRRLPRGSSRLIIILHRFRVFFAMSRSWSCKTLNVAARQLYNIQWKWNTTHDCLWWSMAGSLQCIGGAWCVLIRQEKYHTNVCVIVLSWSSKSKYREISQNLPKKIT